MLAGGLLVALVLVASLIAVAGESSEAELDCSACEAIADKIQTKLASSWRPTKDSNRKRSKRTRKVFRDVCESGFRGYAALETEEAKTQYVNFNEFTSRGGSITGNLNMGPDVEKKLSEMCSELMKGHQAELLERQTAVKRVYDFKLKPVMCNELSGLCASDEDASTDERIEL